MEKKIISVSNEIRKVCPAFVGGIVYAEFNNTQYCEELWAEIKSKAAEMKSRHTVDTIKLTSGIAATRLAYKACGKDPSRYRPSNEQLARRILQGKDLWAVNTAVDIGNLVSIDYGYSVGCFDYDKICGQEITLGIGQADEPYEGIGRGALNIEHMPVYRDAAGGIGTPTSDNERTKISVSTTHMLALINGYDGDRDRVRECVGFMAGAYRKYLDACCETAFFQAVNVTDP